MSDSILARVRALEKKIDAEQAIRRAFTHAQLVQRAHLECTWRRAHPGEEPTPELVSAWEVEVGPPAAVLGPGEKSAGELILECVAAARERDGTRSAQHDSPEKGTLGGLPSKSWRTPCVTPSQSA